MEDIPDACASCSMLWWGISQPSSLQVKFLLQDFVVWPCSRHLKQALFSWTNLTFSDADLLSKALHLYMGCPWWLGCIQQGGFSLLDFLSSNNVCDKWLGSLIFSLRSQNLYSILSLNSSSRFRWVGKLSLAIPGCVLLVAIFIYSFSMGSGSFSSIILMMVELLISFSRSRLFRSICAFLITFTISSIPLTSASTLFFSFFISDIIASTSLPSSPFFLSSRSHICSMFSSKPYSILYFLLHQIEVPLYKCFLTRLVEWFDVLYKFLF